MVEVPGVGGQSPIDRVHNGVFNDEHRARHPRGEEVLSPARKAVGLHQESPGEKPVVCCHLPVHDVLCENMSAVDTKRQI